MILFCETSALERARTAFAADWPRWLVIEVSQELAELAGDYAETFALRAYDSIQLAALQLVARELPGEVQFACFDSRLVKAARVLNIEAI